jgi:hypothetical protein
MDRHWSGSIFPDFLPSQTSRSDSFSDEKKGIDSPNGEQIVPPYDENGKDKVLGSSLLQSEYI